jgi:hypothetical protein
MHNIYYAQLEERSPLTRPNNGVRKCGFYFVRNSKKRPLIGNTVIVVTTKK